MPEVTLESEEWYVLCNWLREEENRLMYSLRSKSREWAFVHDLRREIERRPAGAGDAGNANDAVAADAGARDTGAGDTGGDTEGIVRPVALSDRQVSYLLAYLRRRARRLLVRPWRTRERRDVRHLRDHLLESVERGGRSEPRPTPSDSGRRRG